jgi:outer membrane protein OmpA-like peptidoglycan-associated protein
MKPLVTSFFLLAAFFSIAQTSQQQNFLKQEADKYFSEEQFNLAIQYYQELSNLSSQDAEVNFQLAESYRKSFKYKEAEAYYLKTYHQSHDQFPLSLYYYAMMLKLNGDFDESITYFTEFIFANQHTKSLEEYIEQASVDRAGSEMAKTEFSKSNATYGLSSENINSRFNEYAPALLDSNTLVITSGRVESSREIIDERYGEAYTNNFYFVKEGASWRDKTNPVFNITNSRYNDGSGSFTGNGDKYYFTVCGNEGPHCQIFLSERKGGKWKSPVLLNGNVNLKKFESKHPAISKGGDTLLFSSNRPGGFGQYDIWMSISAGQDNWGPAMNAGNGINTKLNELAPAFSRFSHVFFLASDGHQNYGGLDLYMAKHFSNGTTALYNLDYPFNSTRDDCFLTFGENKIYLSSNREGGKGGFDIYSVAIPSVLSFVSKLSLKNKDARGDIKLNAQRAHTSTSLDLLTARNEDRIEYENLTYEKKKIVDQMVLNKASSKSSKKEDFDGILDKDYQLLINIAEVRYKNQEVEKRFSKTFLTRVHSPLDGKQHFSVSAVLKDSLSAMPLSSRKIFLMDQSGEVLKITTTNEVGEFRFTNIEPDMQVYLRLEILPREISEKPRVEYQTIDADKNQQRDRFENIYFDFDLYTLRPEAKIILNDLAAFLKNTPKAQAELLAYADDVGTDDYNLALTKKRGLAVLNYLTQLGVDQTALAVIAKGGQKSTNTDIEIQRQYNRRIEFYLNGAQLTSIQNSKTYILKKKSDWVSISLSTSVSIEELKKLNGSDAEALLIFQTVRIPLYAKEISNTLFYTIR